MHIWPDGALGRTPPRNPGSSTDVTAVRRFIMLTRGHAHTYAFRATDSRYFAVHSVTSIDSDTNYTPIAPTNRLDGPALRIGAIQHFGIQSLPYLQTRVESSGAARWARHNEHRPADLQTIT